MAKFFGKLIRPIIVWTIGNGDRQPICFCIRPHQVIRSSLARRIGTSWSVGRSFAECRWFIKWERAKHFISGNMVKSDVMFDSGAWSTCVPMTLLCKKIWLLNRAINVCFRSKVNNSGCISHQLIHDLFISDIPLHKRYLRTLLEDF